MKKDDVACLTHLLRVHINRIDGDLWNISIFRLPRLLVPVSQSCLMDLSKLILKNVIVAFFIHVIVNASRPSKELRCRLLLSFSCSFPVSRWRILPSVCIHLLSCSGYFCQWALLTCPLFSQSLSIIAISSIKFSISEKDVWNFLAAKEEPSLWSGHSYVVLFQLCDFLRIHQMFC